MECEVVRSTPPPNPNSNPNPNPNPNRASSDRNSTQVRFESDAEAIQDYAQWREDARRTALAQDGAEDSVRAGPRRAQSAMSIHRPAASRSKQPLGLLGRAQTPNQVLDPRRDANLSKVNLRASKAVMSSYSAIKKAELKGRNIRR